MAKLFYKKYPRFIDTLLNRHQQYNQTLQEIEQAAKKGEIFLLRPSKNLAVGRMERDPARLEAQYNLGRKDALAALPALKEWMKK